MTAKKRINYVELPASDLDLVENFYSSAFGWEFTNYGPDYRAFNDGKTNGGFYRSSLSSSTESGGALIVLYAEDLEGIEQTVLGNGGKIVKAIFEFPGGRRFHFADPTGNELAVWSDK
jgi:predicted enzyme related to lactoylglutathione lyase